MLHLEQLKARFLRQHIDTRRAIDDVQTTSPAFEPVHLAVRSMSQGEPNIAIHIPLITSTSSMWHGVRSERASRKVRAVVGGICLNLLSQALKPYLFDLVSTQWRWSKRRDGWEGSMELRIRAGLR